eukprot:272605_1
MIQAPVPFHSLWFILVNVLFIPLYGETTVFNHTTSTNLADIETFINDMGPSSVTRIFGGISYPNLHVWVANDDSGKQYDFKLTAWSFSVFPGTNADIDIATDNVMAVGFKPTPSPYNYWVQGSGAYTETKSQSTIFEHGHSNSANSIAEIEAFINEMSPSSVTRIFGGVSYPDLHVWAPNDNSGKIYKLHLTTWSAFPGENKDIDVAVNDVMIFDFRPTKFGSAYCYWVEDVTPEPSCADVGGSLSVGHSCQCQSECVDQFCRSITVIQSVMGGSGGYCATGTCCCSCADCVPFDGYL